MAQVVRARQMSGGPPGSHPYFLIEVKLRSIVALNELPTAATFFEAMLGCLSQTQGTFGARSVMRLSASANICARLARSTVTLPWSSSLLTCGSSIWGQLELFSWRMLAPLNNGSRSVWASKKSLNHPVLGQNETCALGTLQNFVYIVEWGTWRKFSLNPMSSSCDAATSAARPPTPESSPTTRILSLPSYLPLLMPAALKYLAMTALSPAGFFSQSASGGGLLPPASSNPGSSGGIWCCMIGPITGPPRVRRSALRSMPAMTALRTLMSSNGLV